MLSFGFIIIKIAFKVVYIWVLEKNIDADAIVINIFEIEWPSKSETLKSFPDIARAESFTVEQALEKINKAMEILIL
jgi:predicted NUDIX family NTP pyrophosphohydrolase